VVKSAAVAFKKRRRTTGSLRVVVVAESFLPSVNGVTNSVLRLIEYLEAAGHEAIVIAPGDGPSHIGSTRVIRLRSLDLPRYDDVRVGIPRFGFSSLLRDLDPDVVHVAAPVVLGAAALRSCQRLGIPSVAIFQTDIAGFAKRHGLGRFGPPIWSYLSWVHSMADVTLAPSRASAWTLRANGVERVEVWPRGVDLERFNPAHRSNELRRFLADDRDVIVGFVGRLAREKQVERLAPIAKLDGVRIVVVGDGPERADLESMLPEARFVGFQSGPELGAFHASFDIFVHTGIDETFCQALQESMASGVAVVAPSAGGPLDLVHQGHTGFFWSPEAPETLLGAVDELVGDRDLRCRLGQAARAEVEQRPWSVVMDRLLESYLMVMGTPRRVRRVA
jgi:phosphatidylinositol alpha 1,6-mannosyltransferase